MSSIYNSASFRMVKHKELERRPIDKHRFLYSVEELGLMHGNFAYLAEMGGVQGLAAALRSDVASGLYSDEVNLGTYEQRKQLYGRNVFERPPLTSFWEHCKSTLSDPVLIVLMVAGAVSIAVGAPDHPSSGWIEGLAIWIAILIVTLVTAGNNHKQERAFRNQELAKKASVCFVRRDNKNVQVTAEDIYAGDLVILSAGDYIPADGVIVTDEPIKCNESSVTGETEDVTRDYYQPFLKAGTEVREGQCVMLSVAVGENSHIGRIMASIWGRKQQKTPLQKQLEGAATIIGKIGAVVAIILFFVLLFRWIADMVMKHDEFKSRLPDVVDFIIISVTIVVVAVPEGLPLAVTVSLAYSMKKMRYDNNFVKELAACETMGNATTICSDKTGTLTQNLMTVIQVYVGGKHFIKIPEPKEITPRLLRVLIEGVVINSKATVAKDMMDPNKSPENWPWKEGNQTECSLMAWLVRYGVDITDERDKYVVEKSYPFDSKKKRSSVILRMPTITFSPSTHGRNLTAPQSPHLPGSGTHKKSPYRQYFKGAAERIAALCDKRVDSEGNEVPLDMDELTGYISGMTSTGLRTIAFCYRDLPKLEWDEDEMLVDPPESKDMVFVGVVGIKDPLRPESRAAVRLCQRAGVIVRMVTGDHMETARFIARDCGILTDERPDVGQLVLEGWQFRRMIQNKDEDQLLKVVPRLRVLARSEPSDKEELVTWLREHGEVVAATGDGTNDAQALHAADVGIAMDIAGTDVAKAAAKILILDDNFASIVKSVMWGRSVFDNIRKFVQFQLTVNLVALTLTLIGAFSDYTNPLKPVQLLWVNLIMDTMAALALGTEVPSISLLKRRPYRKDASLISPVMWRNLIGQAILQLVILCILLFAADLIWDGGSLSVKIESKSKLHYTFIFNTFVFLQLFNEINSRKVNEEFNVFDRFFDNWIFSAVLVITIIFQILMVEVFGSFASTTGLPWSLWIASVVIGTFSLPVGFLIRFIPVNTEWGRIELHPDTFHGLDLSDPIETLAKQLDGERKTDGGESQHLLSNQNNRSSVTSDPVPVTKAGTGAIELKSLEQVIVKVDKKDSSSSSGGVVSNGNNNSNNNLNGNGSSHGSNGSSSSHDSSFFTYRHAPTVASAPPSTQQLTHGSSDMKIVIDPASMQLEATDSNSSVGSTNGGSGGGGSALPVPARGGLLNPGDGSPGSRASSVSMGSVSEGTDRDRDNVISHATTAQNTPLVHGSSSPDEPVTPTSLADDNSSDKVTEWDA